MAKKKSTIFDKIKKSKSKINENKKGVNIEALINSGKYRFNNGDVKKKEDESI